MAKINKFIVKYAEIFKGNAIDFDAAKPHDRLVERFAKIIRKRGILGRH
ncbi:MAG: hypothetical protein WBL47_02065 [Bacilli bacterium]|jgi:hypothetical protein|nr:hypothetical protein [Bacilli bacterium]HPZ26973.1 hypothetical protein [Bacilli bacterium]HQC89379.1 hypothetical protein [Bacilli bacterium]